MLHLRLEIELYLYRFCSLFGGGEVALLLKAGDGGNDAVREAAQHGVVAKTINFTTPDPECDLDYAVDSNREMPVYAALSNSLGFGGHNATICIKKCD